ncbi:microneme protein 13, partial [Cystoisospora suis]
PSRTKRHLFRRASRESRSTRVHIQSELDSWCNSHYKKLCSGGKKAFCDKTALARYGKGITSQQTNQWRCYSKESLNPGGREVQCVDDCGHYFPCIGVINSKTTSHSTAESDIANFIQKAVPKYCSPIQAAGDKFCDSVSKGAVARKDTGRAGQETSQWRCYERASLTYEASGICKDNCGGERLCPGGRSETQGDLTKEHFTREADLQKAFTNQRAPCDSLCIPTPINPPVCVTDENLLQNTKRSKAQAMLDDECQRQFDRNCKSGHKSFCGKVAVARKDKGRAGSQEKAEWRCYSLSELDFRGASSVCIDDCGKELRCQGGVKGVQSVEHTTWKQLPTLIGSATKTFCSARQASANDYCNDVRPGTIARYEAVSGNTEPRWICIDKQELRLEAESKCADKCKGFTTCAGGRSRVDGPLPSNGLEDASRGILDAMKDSAGDC